MHTFYLRFPLSAIPQHIAAYWAASTADDKDRESHIETVIALFMQEHHYLTEDHFRAIVRWKSPRAQTYAARNDDDYRKIRVAILALETRRPFTLLVASEGCASTGPMGGVDLWTSVARAGPDPMAKKLSLLITHPAFWEPRQAMIGCLTVR